MARSRRKSAFQRIPRCLPGRGAADGHAPGAEAAVLVPAAEWKRLQSAARPSLKELLLSDAARTEFLVPPRGAALRRQVAALE